MIKNWFKDESGQALSEYGLLIAVIAVAIIVAVAAFRKNLVAAFDNAGKSLENQSVEVKKDGVL